MEMPSTMLSSAPASHGTTPAGRVGESFGRPLAGWRLRLYTIIFEADTPAGRWFDILLIVAIVVSVGAVVAESVEAVERRHGATLLALEWFFTVLFTVEYLLRSPSASAALRAELSASSTCCRSCRPTSACCFRVRTSCSTSACCGCCGSSGS
jgi:hypothetical protein